MTSKTVMRALALCLLPLSTGCILQIKGAGTWGEPGSSSSTYTSHAPGEDDGPRVRGSGVLASESRAAVDFDSITVDDRFVVVVRVGLPHQVTLEADDNVLEYVRTHVHGDTLEIDMEPGTFRFSSTPRVAIDVPALEELELNGSNSVEVSGLTGEDLEIIINAAGSVQARGNIEDLYVEVNGSGSLDLMELVVDAAEVEINGVGTGKLHAIDQLEVTINGTGTLVYRGSPQTRFEINGAGQILAE